MRSEKVIEKLEIAKNDYLNSSISLRNLAIKYNLNRGLLSGFLLGKNIDIYSRKSNVNNLIFSKIDTEEKAYWLGFLYADGNVGFDESKNINRVEIGLKESDHEHLIKFTKFLDSQKEIKFRKSTKSCRIMFSSKSMCEDLIKLGCVPKKSLILKFPTYDQVPKILMRHFIRGYFDGDGCLSLSKKSSTFTVSVIGTKEFLTGILNEMNIKNLGVMKKDKRHKNNTFYIRFKIKEGFDFLKQIYSDSIIFLDRKKELFNIAVNRRNFIDNKRAKTVKAEMLIPC